MLRCMKYPTFLHTHWFHNIYNPPSQSAEPCTLTLAQPCTDMLCDQSWYIYTIYHNIINLVPPFNSFMLSYELRANIFWSVSYTVFLIRLLNILCLINLPSLNYVRANDVFFSLVYPSIITNPLYLSCSDSLRKKLNALLSPERQIRTVTLKKDVKYGLGKSSFLK